jgi:hypothetical protein
VEATFPQFMQDDSGRQICKTYKMEYIENKQSIKKVIQRDPVQITTNKSEFVSHFQERKRKQRKSERINRIKWQI